MEFRQVICVLLHVSCTLIASMGLRRAWLMQRHLMRPAQLDDAYVLLTVAIVVHGFYNFLCVSKIINPVP